MIKLCALLRNDGTKFMWTQDALLTGELCAVAFNRMVYRRHREHRHGAWHFNSQCPFWPQANYVEGVASLVQKTDVLCSECMSLALSKRHDLDSDHKS